MTGGILPGGFYIPEGLAWWRAEPGGAEWLARLPEIVAACVEQWGVALGPPFAPASVSFVAPAELPDGRQAVLKINCPDPESEHEAGALLCYQGEGAARLIAHDPTKRALLIERCAPGTQLWEVEEPEAYRIAASVLRRLFRPAPPRHPFSLLRDEARRWAHKLPEDWEKLGRPFEQALVDEAAQLARALSSSQGEEVVLHQDLHGGNILRAEREPWLAIDPKPLVGEREFDCASLLRDRRGALARDPDPVGRIERRLDLLARELDLSRERMRGWALVHSLAWGVTDRDWSLEMVACARWLACIR